MTILPNSLSLHRSSSMFWNVEHGAHALIIDGNFIYDNMRNIVATTVPRFFPNGDGKMVGVVRNSYGRAVKLIVEDHEFNLAEMLGVLDRAWTRGLLSNLQIQFIEHLLALILEEKWYFSKHWLFDFNYFAEEDELCRGTVFTLWTYLAVPGYYLLAPEPEVIDLTATDTSDTVSIASWTVNTADLEELDAIHDDMGDGIDWDWHFDTDLRMGVDTDGPIVPIDIEVQPPSPDNVMSFFNEEAMEDN